MINGNENLFLDTQSALLLTARVIQGNNRLTQVNPRGVYPVRVRGREYTLSCLITPRRLIEPNSGFPKSKNISEYNLMSRRNILRSSAIWPRLPLEAALNISKSIALHSWPSSADGPHSAILILGRPIRNTATAPVAQS
jgi:hypothetical protein